MKRIAFIVLSVLSMSACLFFLATHFPDKIRRAKGVYVRIPVQLIDGSAVIAIEVEGMKIPVEIDLGASCQFALFKEVLDNIKTKEFQKTIKTFDLKGNEYQEKNYLIPEIKAKAFLCESASVNEESIDFVAKGAVIWQAPGDPRSSWPFEGRIGRRFFSPYNLFLDFPNSMMFITTNLDQLKMDHWHIQDLLEVPFEMHPWGILLSVDTDLGTRRLILDTGASISSLRNSSMNNQPIEEVAPGKQMFRSEKFVISGHNFGKMDFILFEMSPDIEADGLLGMNFLKNHAIFLDFQKNKAFIGPSSEVCGTILLDDDL